MRALGFCLCHVLIGKTLHCEVEGCSACDELGEAGENGGESWVHSQPHRAGSSLGQCCLLAVAADGVAWLAGANALKKARLRNGRMCPWSGSYCCISLEAMLTALISVLSALIK